MEQIELLKYVISVLENLEVPYMIVGSLSSSIYGEPRMTRDIDIVIRLERDQVNRLSSAFPTDEYYMSNEAAYRALDDQSQFNVIHGYSGNKIDFMIARSDTWSNEQLSRRRRIELLPNLYGYVASPEDVIIGKLIYYNDGHSEKHLRDIASILKINGSEIDKQYIEKWTKELKLTEVWKKAIEQSEG